MLTDYPNEEGGLLLFFLILPNNVLSLSFGVKGLLVNTGFIPIAGTGITEALASFIISAGVCPYSLGGGE